MLAGNTAKACTLWAANGTAVVNGGSLIVKNRDWLPNQQQKVKLVSPAEGYRYFGIFAVDGSYKGLKAGINEKGLVVVNASASSIPRAQRNQMPYTHALTARLLNECSSVDEVIAEKDLFIGPLFLMAADKKKIVSIEIGPEGNFAVDVKQNEAIYHTNHYIDNSMQEFNQVIGPSSQQRFDRIGQLLNSASQPYDLDTFIAFSSDASDGPDNSIFRTGSTPKKERTMAVWAVSIPQDQSPELYIRLLNKDAEKVIRIKAEDVFSGRDKLE